MTLMPAALVLPLTLLFQPLFMPAAASVVREAVDAAGQAPAEQAPAPPDAEEDEFVPRVGQEGKDVVWVPTSPELLELMLDMARVGPEDFVMDLGSGDGRNVIAAAKRGARGRGVEYNPDMVRLSQRLAREAGVDDRVEFVQGDMYEADVSEATVLALFLLPSNLERLKDRFLALRPGTRIVLNTFTFNDWEPDEQQRLEDGCVSWCTSLLHIVPARVAGTWRLDDATLELEQNYQYVKGTLRRGDAAPVPVTGRLRGAGITLEIDGRTYEGQVDGSTMAGTVDGASWTATR